MPVRQQAYSLWWTFASRTYLKCSLYGRMPGFDQFRSFGQFDLDVEALGFQRDAPAKPMDTTAERSGRSVPGHELPFTKIPGLSWKS